MISTRLACRLTATLLLPGLFPVVTGAILTYDNLNATVPDNDPNGLANTQPVLGLTGALADVSVSLNLEGVGDGGFNGDLYVLLEHNGTSVVLLNRPGKTSSNPFGYSDNGLNVSFSDSANRDVHNYRSVLSGDPTVGLTGQLTGNWSPDGRYVDPALVVDADPQTSHLADLKPTNPNGNWTLFVADLSPGSQVKLKSWGLTVNTLAAISESSISWTTFSAVALGLGICRGRKLSNG